MVLKLTNKNSSIIAGTFNIPIVGVGKRGEY